jgi:tetratricopeptide (TPR) repeat protein
MNKAEEPSKHAQQALTIEQSLERALRHLIGGQLSQAEGLYQQILQADPAQPVALHFLGVIAHQKGDGLLGVDLMTKALAIKPDYAEAHNNLGNALKDLGRAEEAVASFRKALDVKPDNAKAHFNLGNLLCDLGEHDAAAASYQKAVAIAPDYAEAYLNLGNLLQDQGKLDQAAASFREAIAIKPDMPEAHFNLGNALKSLGQLEAAVECYHQALAVKPDYAGAHGNLGNALKHLGQLEEAVASYRQALVIKPDCVEDQSNLGLALNDQGKFDEAVACFHRALAIKPDYAEAQSNLGNALKDQGRLDEAVASYRKALAIKPDYVEAQNNLGVALQDQGKLDEAVACYRKVLAINPDFAEGWNGLSVSTVALRFSEPQKFQTSLVDKDWLSSAACSTTSFALYEYYLDRFKPHLADQSFNKAMASLSLRVDEEITDTGTELEPADPPRLPDKLVALLHFGRSGTGLFHSLIDGHPEISTLPSVYLSGFFNDGAWKKIAADGWRDLAERFADEYAVLFDANAAKSIASGQGAMLRDIGRKEGMTCVGADRSEALFVDRDKFCSEAHRLMKCLGKIDPRSFLFIVHAAFEKALETKTTKDTVFYHIHNPSDFATLNFLRYAPDARLVMMVREPIQSCESWIRGLFPERDYGTIVLRIIAMLFAIDQVPFRTQESVGIRLEDLKGRPQETMRSLCAWLGIEESPNLYEMTAQGKKWWGDPTSPDYDPNEAMSPFGKSSISRATGTLLSEKDQLVLRTLFYPFSVRFGYRPADPDQFQKDLKAIRPMLDNMLDFEKTLAERSNTDSGQFKRNGMYQYFRAGLVARWDVLDELGDYPHMLKPLAIGSEVR